MSRSLTSAPVDSEGARALYQQRVSLLARITLILGLLIQAVVRWVAFTMKGTPLAASTEWTPNVHLLVLACGAGIWLRTRAGRRSPFELSCLDISCVLVPFLFSSAALWNSAPLLRPNLIHVLGTSNLLILRAVLIPSSGRRTALIGLLFSVAVVVWTYAYYRRFGAHDVAPPSLFTGVTSVWCAMAVIISSVASHTIFGLRERVREAKQLGQYVLTRKIGEGGMGVVYEARHALLRRRTAVKLLPISKSGEHNASRFEREVRLTSTLTHPNTISIFDYGRSPDGVFYYAMEYLDGIDLQKLVERAGPQSVAITAHILEQVCGALSEAHAAGLIHRDIKPANVILCERGGTPGVAKVVDFGLVKNLGVETISATQTASESMLGTPLYMSPEAIARPEAVDARSDLYAVGAVGYFLVTGVPVFSGATSVEVCAHHLHATPVRPSERVGAELGELEELLLECLAKDPNLRPASARALSARFAALRAESKLEPEVLAAWWERCRALPSEPRADPQPFEPPSSATTVLNVELGVR
ncbi:MAG TPA: serine/threonine-protein kinase [Polyangiaceae bacterium]|nr:serine/threonine-protein kinase [Polyangiaceae bacterium]